MSTKEDPVLYVLVVGFHHKKGCQVEYSFPPLVPGAPNECPPGWKYLPTLALPDGSHNFDEDTVYFHLPSLTDSRSTVFGISCFRQIPVERLKNRTADITRGTVQKSVCVLSRLPLYGHIQVKMALITHAYFDEGDFSKVSLLEDTYHHLNSVLLQNESPLQTYVGLSAREFILQWKHKALLLFKLLLLEKRIVFFKSPVHSLCSTILTLISLYPKMIEEGLKQSACIKLSRPMSPMPDFSDEDVSPNTPHKDFIRSDPTQDIPTNCDTNQRHCPVDVEKEQISLDELENPVKAANGTLECMDATATEMGMEITEANDADIKNDNLQLNGCIPNDSNSLHRDVSADVISETNMQNSMSHLAHINAESCGFPLQMFTKGYLCLPYLSLPYMDLLSDVNVRGYVTGATNVLFKQKRQLYDILIDIDSGRIECQDLELRKLLHLTTEDLRFADFLVKHVADERHDVFLDGVGWEGGDEWIRTQFKIYLICLLRSSLLQDGSREIEHFGSNFMTAWRDTHNYKMWLSGIKPGILEVNPGHPFAGQLSVADMKLRLSHTMQNTEGGRKLNQAMASTGRAMATTGKAVGGAISQAKGAFSSWWNNLLISPEPIQRGVDVANENINGSNENGKHIVAGSNTDESKENINDINKSLNDAPDEIVSDDLNSKNDNAHAEGEIHVV